MRIAARKHDLIALRINDKRENDLPSIGLVKFQDAETGQQHWVDTSSSDTKAFYHYWISKKTEELNSVFKKCGVDNALIFTDEDYVKPLMKLFKKREARH